MRKAPIPADTGIELRNSPPIDIAALAVVTVTYHPDLEVLARQLGSIPVSALKVVVDNASAPSERLDLQRLCAAHPRCFLVENEVNAGLPAAINQGVQHAISISPDCRHLLILDQDTEPGQDGVSRLLRSYEDLSAADPKLGCVGPRLVDANSGLDHGFHRIAGWRWVRRYPAAGEPPVECSNLNCSGSLMKVDLFNRLGGFEEDLFIDHLDTEWSFRVLAAGYKLLGIPSVVFRHRMGEASWRFWLLRWRIWPYRAPQRHYFLFRNALRLIRRPYVPGVWKFWAAVKLLLTLCVHALFDRRRRQQVAAMTRGIRAGLKTEAR